MAKRILAWSEGAGQFYREIGNKPDNGKPARIYLGADEKKAAANVARLEALWDASRNGGGARERRGQHRRPFPVLG